VDLDIVSPGFCSVSVLPGWLVGLLLIGNVLVGCNSPEVKQEVKRRGSNLQSLAGMYRMYSSENGGHPPANETDLKNFIQEQGLEHFEPFGITTVDDLFISPRDGEPYVVVYGGSELPEILAYERLGTETGRWIVSSMAVVAEVNESAFKELFPNEP